MRLANRKGEEFWDGGHLEPFEEECVEATGNQTKLFVFRPYKEWGYCGGCVIVAADSFEDVRNVIQETANDCFGDKAEHFIRNLKSCNKNDIIPVFREPERHQMNDKTHDVWVCVEIIPTTEGRRLVFVDWNWA